MQEKTAKLLVDSKKGGLHISTEKTDHLTISNEDETKVRIGDVEIVELQEF